MCFPLFLSWGKVFDAKKRLVLCRHILEREVEDHALIKLSVATTPRYSDGRKEKKRESDGHSGGLWVVDETRPRSAFCVLLVLGKDILEEGATSTTRISLQLESRFIIPNRFRSLSLSRRVGGEYNGVVFARGKNATLTLKITSPFVRASSRSSR